jgi:N-methylhydantoinase A
VVGQARLGVDVGGTFTDLVHAVAGRVEVAKVPSTPDDQTTGILSGMERLGLDAATLRRFAHGTTVATNTVLERDGARTVLVTTRGFADLLQIARQDRPRLYDLGAERARPVVDRGMAVEAAERIDADGEVREALTDDEIARVVTEVGAREPEAVVVCLLFSFLRPDHERRLAAALVDAGHDTVTTSSALLPVFREVERTSTAALNAYVAPRMERYLASLERRLEEEGLTAPVEVMRSGGGTFTAGLAAREPVHTLLSGPAAGAWGAAALGRAAGVGEVIGCDMGGTSTDVTLIEGGRPATTAEGAIDGLPFAVTATDIHTVGSGGGSIAWRDEGGALRVGPRSAGAEPGPAAYGRGGRLPTVTDANVVLGRLDPGVRLGGAMPLRDDLALDAVRELAAELDLEPGRCADGVLRVVEAQMAKALRVVSVERGRDPRSFALVPFGGAGPLHQAALAAELGCREVLVPPNPGVLSALGLLAAPITVDRAQSRLTALADADRDGLAAAWDRLAEEARQVVEGQDVEVAAERRTADLRYHGQAHELEVDADDPDPRRLEERLHEAHHERYGYAQREEGVELVTLRVRVEGPAPQLPLVRLTGGSDVEAATLATRDVLVEGRPTATAIVDRSALGAGARLRGPAVVVGLDATCFVAPWQAGEVDEHGSLRLSEHTG